MLLITYGTRPEYIKIKPLLGVIDKNRIKILFTGQHPDIVDKNLVGGVNSFISIRIKKRDNRLDSIVQSILGNEDIFQGVSAVLVQGDTASAFSVALAAFHRRIPVVHLEAGLRSYDINFPYPEELYRVAIDRMSSILFCPTKGNRDNLIREGIKKNVYVTGNTALDNLRGVTGKYKYNVLCTIHRRDNQSRVKDWFKVLTKLSCDFPEFKFIIPLHPSPVIQAARGFLGGRVEILKPLTHEKTINILKDCMFVITDSGGIQEEASFLKKRTFVCREVTERVECLGKSSVLCPTPNSLYDSFRKYRKDFVVKTKSPYGDGRASRKILKRLKENNCA